MKKINALILSFSTVLFAQPASAQWSIGGFAGQSNARSLIDCRGGDFATTTLTTRTLDQAAFNAALAEATDNGVNDLDFVGDIDPDSLIIDANGIFQSFPTFDTGSVLGVLERRAAGEFDIIQSRTLFGTLSELNIETTTTTNISSFISADFTGGTSVDDFEVVNFDTIDLGDFLTGATETGNFDASDLGEFLRAPSGTIPTADVGNIIPTSTLDIINSFESDGISSSLLFTESLTTFECNNDTNDFGYGLNVAYNFNKTWGIEAGYVDLGEFSSEFSARDAEVVGFPTTATVDATAFYLAATGSYYYNKKWSVTGRAGIYSLDADRSIESGGVEVFSDSKSDEDFYYGVSWNYDLSEPIQLQLRYDHFDADVFSLGLKYRFGR